MPPNNFPFYKASEKYAAAMQADGGQLSGAANYCAHVDQHADVQHCNQSAPDCGHSCKQSGPECTTPQQSKRNATDRLHAKPACRMVRCQGSACDVQRG